MLDILERNWEAALVTLLPQILPFAVEAVADRAAVSAVVRSNYSVLAASFDK